MKRLVASFSVVAALVTGITGGAWAESGPASQANCIAAASSGGAEGEFASSSATSLAPGEFGAGTSEALGGGTYGAVARSNECE